MKDKIFSWIENSIPMAVELETELTKRPAISPDSGGEGELDKCLFIESWLKQHGITRLERYDAPDSKAKGGIRPNLIATIDGEDENSRFWIMSHTDVVPPGELTMWDSDPWTVTRADDPPRLIGRGVEDNQQGIVASMLAALAFTKQGLKPRRTIKLLFCADEEMGSHLGIVWLINNHGDLFRKDDMVLVPDGGDPAGENMEIAEKNIIWARFVTRGKQGHGSRPDLCANACLAAADLMSRLHHELSAKFSDHDPLFEPVYSTFEPTKKEANVPNINTIPGEDVSCMDMRILPRYSVKSVLAEVDRIRKEIEAKYKVSIEYTTPQNIESKTTSVEAPVVKALGRAISEVYGVKPKPIGIGGGTMGAFLRNVDIDSVIWTKTAVSMHQPNEYALLKNIIGDAKVMALMALS